jgi:hypothetical protein
MEMRCYPCRHGQCDVCIDVGCICLACMASTKDEYPLDYPIYVGGSRVCLLSQPA